MKKTVTCPVCEGRQILHVESMKLPVLAPDDSLARLPVLARATTWKKAGISIGGFETFICKACGYTGWYAEDPAGITPEKSLGIRLLDNTPKATLR